MVKKKKMKVAFAAFAGVMFFGGLAFSPNKSQAAKKVSITKSVKVYEGKNEKKLTEPCTCCVHGMPVLRDCLCRKG